MKYFCLVFLILAICSLFADGNDCPVCTEACTKELKPVCSNTGCGYDNSCELECAGQVLGYYGRCVTDNPWSD